MQVSVPCTYLAPWLTSTLNWRQQVKWVFYTKRSLRPSANTSPLQLYLAYIHSHLEYTAPVWDPLQQELFNWESAEVWLTDRSVHQKLEFWIWLSASVMHLPTLASRRRMYTMKLLPLAVSTAPIVPQNLSRNTSLLTIEKPVTHMNVY